eukprot:TRINITY_DN23137_c0_g1_i1.p1 TRINITY_DN23137_c0_g1~~TRINITY_DN23137_c0_g1_i1.p1  ORF type:complete len:259 (+),score=21.68 TRINITY_DN23137_c0_g1_i1:148-924(+)
MGGPWGELTTTTGVCGCLFAIAVAAAFELQRGSWSDLLRAWWVDPAVATLSFSFWIDVYDREERHLLRPDPRGGATLISAGVVYWVGVASWSSLVPQPGGGALPDGVPSSIPELGVLALEVASGVLMYDLIFFFVHWFMHAGVFKAHKRHHSLTDLRARDVLEHSVLDGSLQVLVNIFVQRHTPWGGVKSRLARAIHNVVVTWMLTESHTAAPTKRVWRRWFKGVQRHRSHHLETAPYYQQFFGYLDDARLGCLSSKQ